jgi:pyruvate,water dikinase
MAIGRELVAKQVLDEADDVMFLRYQELRVLMADPAAVDGRRIVARRHQDRAVAYTIHPRDWIGTVTPASLAAPFLSNWGYPDRFYKKPSTVEGQITGLAASPGRVEGLARVVLTTAQFDQVQRGEIVVCQMTNPAWVALFTKMTGLVTDAGGLTSHPAVLAREFGIPAVIGTSVATQKIRTGDRIRINGSTGIVDILSTGAEVAGVGYDAPATTSFTR